MPKEIEEDVAGADEMVDVALDVEPDADLDELEDEDDALLDDDPDDDDALVDDLEDVVALDDVVGTAGAGEVVVPPRVAESDEAAAEEEEEEELDDDDVEASLDVILKERLVVEDEDEEEDEDEPADVEDRSEGSLRVLPKQPGEFVCQSCFLVKSESQLADPARMLCRDCV